MRLQRIIDERFGNFNRFDKAMRAARHSELASTAHGWLPPQDRWRAQPDGSAVRRIDWVAVRSPDPALLIEFCDVLKVRADFVLFGEGAPYRGQLRTNQALEEDLATRILRELPSGISDFAEYGVVNGRRLIEDSVEATVREIRAWQDWQTAMWNEINNGAVRVAALYSGAPEQLIPDKLKPLQLARWLLEEVCATMMYFRPSGERPGVPVARFITLHRLRATTFVGKTPFEVEFTTVRNPRDAPQIVMWLVRAALEQLKAVRCKGLEYLPDGDQPASVAEWLKLHRMFWYLDGMDALPIGPGKTPRPRAG
jgi:hypothetical protein